jgi:hypothetical protein
MFSLQTIFGSGQQFYTLLEEASQAALESAKALHAMLMESDRQPALDAFKLARLRERATSDKISQALVDSFITPIEREDIEALGSALYKIPKQIEKFADRYSLALQHLEGRHRGHAGAEIAQSLAARAQRERRGRGLLGENHPVEALVRLGERGVLGRPVPVHAAAIHEHSADHDTVSREELGGRVHDEVRALVERPGEDGRGDRGI